MKKTKKTISIVLISDCMVEPWFSLYLESVFGENKIKVIMHRYSFSERYDVKEEGERIVWLSPENIDEIKATGGYADIWIVPDISCYECNIITYGGRVEANKGDILGKNVRGTAILLQSIIDHKAINGVTRAEDDRWGIMYIPEIYAEVARECWNVYQIEKGRRKKCLILDCDNVLWNGILEEDGIGYVDCIGKEKLYALVHELSEHGIIVCLCSKNNLDELQQEFNAENKLHEIRDDIDYWGVGWKRKSEIIEEMLSDLRIDSRDVVFVDDSESEILDIQLSFPEMETVIYKQYEAEKRIKKIFPIKQEDKSIEATLRKSTYQDDEKRRSLERESISKEDYLKKLNTIVTVREAKEEECNRIGELSRRTNRCTNGIRFSDYEIKKMWNDSRYHIWVVHVSDIFRDLGIVGTIIIDDVENEIQLFCLSCRVLGRDIEKQMLSAFKGQIKKILWTDTGKNEDLKRLLDTMYIPSAQSTLYG